MIWNQFIVDKNPVLSMIERENTILNGWYHLDLYFSFSRVDFKKIEQANVSLVKFFHSRRIGQSSAIVPHS
jgi:hypothetical protein